MTEKTKANIYLAYLDLILKKEKYIKPVEDAEVSQLLTLSKIMLAEDFSINSKTRYLLKKQLLTQISPEDKFLLPKTKDNNEPEDELREEDLEYVAGGLTDPAGEVVRPYCGARFNKLKNKCPFCLH